MVHAVDNGVRVDEKEFFHFLSFLFVVRIAARVRNDRRMLAIILRYCYKTSYKEGPNMHHYVAEMYPEKGGGLTKERKGFLAASDADASAKFRRIYKISKKIWEAALYRIRGGRQLIEHYQGYM